MKFIVAVSLILTLSLSIAQPVILRSDVLQPGDMISLSEATAVPDPGMTGPGVVWDFSATQSSPIADFSVNEASATTNGAQFPSANIAVSDKVSGIYQYYDIAENLWEDHGFIDEGFATLTYQNPRTYLQLPMTFGNQWQDDFAYTTQYQTVPPVTTYGEGVLSAVVDGYGVLSLPQATFTDALRVKVVAVSNDTSNLGQGLYERNDYHDTTYLWMSPSYPGPLCMLVRSVAERKTYVVSGDTLVFPETVTYQSFTFDPDASPVSAVANFNNREQGVFSVMTNPVANSLRVLYTIDKGTNVVVEILDVNAHPLRKMTVDLHPGTDILNFDLGDIPSGVYFLSVKLPDQIFSEKLIITE